MEGVKAGQVKMEAGILVGRYLKSSQELMVAWIKRVALRWRRVDRFDLYFVDGSHKVC